MIALLQTPFRPFFALATISAISLMAVWLLSWHGEVTAARYHGPIGWHVHEMLFGYTTAMIAGFLLTAARNWSGRATAGGTRLLGLALVWLAGRVAPWLDGLDPGIIAIMDIAFLPLLALASAPAILASANRANRIFLVILALMVVANLWAHAEALAIIRNLGRGHGLMLDLVVFLMLILGGRLLPFFTKSATSVERRDYPLALNRWILTLFLVATAMRAGSMLVEVSSAILIVTGIFQFTRLLRWFHPGITRHPMLTVLHAGFACVAIGLVLTGISGFGGFVRSYATHLLTVGGIGMLTMGMMARVSLGHTGRPITASATTSAAFLLVALAVLLRVTGPWFFPAHYIGWILLSGAVWIAAFLILLVQYLPYWLGPRVDGKPG